MTANMTRQSIRHKSIAVRYSAGLLLTATLLLPVTSEAARLFRYTDERGNLVMSYTIPNDRVKYGYEVVNESGQLIEKVDRQLTDAEYSAKMAREEMLKTCSIALRRVQTMYQGLADVDSAEVQALESIDTRIANAKANLGHVQNQKGELEGQAAQLDIQGRSIPNELLDNIARANAQEKNLLAEIDLRFAEKLQVRHEL